MWTLTYAGRSFIKTIRFLIYLSIIFWYIILDNYFYNYLLFDFEFICNWKNILRKYHRKLCLKICDPPPLKINEMNLTDQRPGETCLPWLWEVFSWQWKECKSLSLFAFTPRRAQDNFVTLLKWLCSLPWKAHLPSPSHRIYILLDPDFYLFIFSGIICSLASSLPLLAWTWQV